MILILNECSVKHALLIKEKMSLHKKVIKCIYINKLLFNSNNNLHNYIGFTNISCVSALLEHMNSVDHCKAEKLEISRITMKNIIGNFCDKNFKHIISVMKIVYFLSKNDIPLRKLPSHVQLAIELGATDITEGSITYSNEISGHEMLIAISKTLEEQFWNELLEVSAFGIMIDESTDIQVTKHLDIYVTYVMNDGKIKTRLLQLPACDAILFHHY